MDEFIPSLQENIFKLEAFTIPLNNKTPLSLRPCEPKYLNTNQKKKNPLTIQL